VTYNTLGYSVRSATPHRTAPLVTPLPVVVTADRMNKKEPALISPKTLLSRSLYGSKTKALSYSVQLRDYRMHRRRVKRLQIEEKKQRNKQNLRLGLLILIHAADR